MGAARIARRASRTHVEAVVAVGVNGAVQGLERVINLAAFLAIVSLLEVNEEVAPVGAVADAREVLGRERHLGRRHRAQGKHSYQRGSQQGGFHFNLWGGEGARSP